MASRFMLTPLHIPSLVIFCQHVCSLQSKQGRIIKWLLTLGAQAYPLHKNPFPKVSVIKFTLIWFPKMSLPQENLQERRSGEMGYKQLRDRIQQSWWGLGAGRTSFFWQQWTILSAWNVRITSPQGCSFTGGRARNVFLQTKGGNLVCPILASYPPSPAPSSLSPLPAADLCLLFHCLVPLLIDISSLK